jgi:hypothetical protein
VSKTKKFEVMYSKMNIVEENVGIDNILYEKNSNVKMMRTKMKTMNVEKLGTYVQ